MNETILKKGLTAALMGALPILWLIINFLFLPLDVCAELSTQKTFSSPDRTVKALVRAAQSKGDEQLMRLFGPDGRDVIFSGDPAADRQARKHFLERYRASHRLVRTGKNRAILLVGKDQWSFPVPIVKAKKGWFLDTGLGREEILNRRIGGNEIGVLGVMEGYVEAQNEYFRTDWDHDGIYEYASVIMSTMGQRDGLYWEAKPGEKCSPMGPLIAGAADAGSRVPSSTGEPAPYHGYFYKVLNGQGKAAKGGLYDYSINGQMIFGFGLLAYPARYGVSGIKTFMVNHQGVIYEKDLGKGTAEVVKAISRFDPGIGWSAVLTVQEGDRQTRGAGGPSR
jgi:hypothetical protein